MRKHFIINSKFTAYMDSHNGIETYYINNRKIENDSDGTPISNKEEHCKAKAMQFYQTYFSAQFENLVVLSGAGTSVGIGSDGKLGKTISQLWDDCVKSISGTTVYSIEELCKVVKYPVKPDFKNIEEKNIEKLLSLAHVAKDFIDDSTKLNETITTIESLIQEKCNLAMPNNNSPHLTFLNKLVKRKLRLPRVKIFTLNYDTLFEQAARKGGFIVIDGFTFPQPRKFDGRMFNYDLTVREMSRINQEENFVPKLVHLYKIHGSLDWEKQTNGEVHQKETKNPLMIYPKSNKYEFSYDQPFFEMMSRFQQEIRKENTLLICAGFSFHDKHLVTAIKEALYSNPSFRMAIVTLNIDNIHQFEEYKALAANQSNLILIDEMFETFSQNYPEISVYS